MAITSNDILLTLRDGAASAPEVAARLRVDGSTISRHLQKLGEQVLPVGRGRARRYYARRSVADESAVPLYRITREGECQHFAVLYPVYPQEHFVVEYHRSATEVEWREYDALPWWLSDMRPQGFLGRQLAERLVAKGLHVSTDPREWSENDVLTVLITEPQDAVGNLLIGQQAYTRWLEGPTSRDLNPTQVAEQAEQVAAGAHFDSSAKGEQPKLVAVVEGLPSIVKFSGRAGGPQAVNVVAQRWADLLRCEAHAAVAMNTVQAGFAADNRSYSVDQRTFLQSVRFDRFVTDSERYGRAGVVSFACLDLEFVGDARLAWPSLAQRLFAQNVISERAMVGTAVAWAFGQLIGNSDMHHGNLSVYHEGARPYELTPVYDMLPMHFAPTAAGDMRDTVWTPRTDACVRTVHWQTAAAMADVFWQHVAADELISAEFRALMAAQRSLARTDDE
ncbi:type II toxin-antitoxin system HipA family toxin YjjJ [Pseudidiomarina homiensis]|uniref:type II toxin-antitoxin system HipA family toxin YjjJ n=1 Tax=Pseudidiomarina homiensis TaxID=364198 RepID=UPI00215AE3F3|nr:type II toxin-antitoxin system HipA family toxin YjjJ [Pseudidiomarina homiensis]